MALTAIPFFLSSLSVCVRMQAHLKYMIMNDIYLPLSVAVVCTRHFRALSTQRHQPHSTRQQTADRQSYSCTYIYILYVQYTYINMNGGKKACASFSAAALAVKPNKQLSKSTPCSRTSNNRKVELLFCKRLFNAPYIV